MVDVLLFELNRFNVHFKNQFRILMFLINNFTNWNINELNFRMSEKFRKFYGITPAFVEVTREVVVGTFFPPILNRVKKRNK